MVIKDTEIKGKLFIASDFDLVERVRQQIIIHESRRVQLEECRKKIEEEMLDLLIRVKPEIATFNLEGKGFSLVEGKVVMGEPMEEECFVEEPEEIRIKQKQRKFVLPPQANS